MRDWPEAAWRWLYGLFALAAAGGALALPARAADFNYTFGTGPDSYISHGFDFSLDLDPLPLTLSGLYSWATGDGFHFNQTNAGVDWQADDWISTRFGYNRIEDDIFVMEGGEGGLTVDLAHFLSALQLTQLGFTLGMMNYTPNTAKAIPPALLAKLPEQTHYGVSLYQQLPKGFSFTLSYDLYDYSNDPVALATAIATAFLKHHALPPGPAYAIASFPDHGWGGGISWDGDSGLGLDLTYGETQSAIGQMSRNVSLGARYKLKHFNLGVTGTYSFSDAVTTGGGVTLIPASDGTYVELRFGLEL